MLQPTAGTCSYSKLRKNTITCNQKQVHIRKNFKKKNNCNIGLFLKSEKVQPH